MLINLIMKNSYKRILLISFIFIGVIIGLSILNSYLLYFNILIISIGVIILLLAKIEYLIYILPILSIIWIPIVKLKISNSIYNLTLLDTSFIILYLFLILALIKRDNIKFEKLYLSFLVYLLIVPSIIGALLLTGDIFNALNGVLVYVKRFALYSVLPIVFWLNKKKLKINSIFKSIISASILFSSYTIFSNIFNKGIGPYNPYGDRAVGLAFNPNILGNINVIFINFILGILISSNIKLKKSLLLFSLLLQLISLLFSGSREAFIGFLISIFIWLIELLKGKKIKIKISKLIIYYPIIISVVIGIFIILPNTSLFSRINDLLNSNIVNDPNVVGRLIAWGYGFKVLRTYPMGIGISNLYLIGNNFVNNNLLPTFGTTDNQFLDILIETGPIGLIIFLFIIRLMLYNLQSKNYINKSIKINILIMCIIGFAAFTFYNPMISSLIWYLYSLILIFNSKDERELC